MRRLVAVIAVVCMVFVAAGCTGDDEPDRAGPPATFKAYKACDLLTLDDAKQLIGPDATRNEVGDMAAASTEDISVDLCQYSNAAATVYASVLTRVPRTEEGARDNESGFDASRPKDAQNVDGLGDRAYFDPEMGQLYVLAKRVYLIFESGKGTEGEAFTLEDAKKLADLVLPRL